MISEIPESETSVFPSDCGAGAYPVIYDNISVFNPGPEFFDHVDRLQNPVQRVEEKRCTVLFRLSVASGEIGFRAYPEERVVKVRKMSVMF